LSLTPYRDDCHKSYLTTIDSQIRNATRGRPTLMRLARGYQCPKDILMLTKRRKLWIVGLAILGLACIVGFLAFVWNIHARYVFYTARMFDATNTGDIPEMERLIAQYPSLVDARDNSTFTPLMVATCNRRLDVVEFLLKNGAKASLKDGKLQGNALDWANRCLFECTDEFRRSEKFALEIAGKSDKEIEEHLAGLKKERGEEARQKWLKIKAVLADALEKEKGER
jgi:hypothetical protein